MELNNFSKKFLILGATGLLIYFAVNKIISNRSNNKSEMTTEEDNIDKSKSDFIQKEKSTTESQNYSLDLTNFNTCVGNSYHSLLYACLNWPQLNSGLKFWIQNFKQYENIGLLYDLFNKCHNEIDIVKDTVEEFKNIVCSLKPGYFKDDDSFFVLIHKFAFALTDYKLNMVHDYDSSNNFSIYSDFHYDRIRFANYEIEHDPATILNFNFEFTRFMSTYKYLENQNRFTLELKKTAGYNFFLKNYNLETDNKIYENTNIGTYSVKEWVNLVNRLLTQSNKIKFHIETYHKKVLSLPNFNKIKSIVINTTNKNIETGFKIFGFKYILKAAVLESKPLSFENQDSASVYHNFAFLDLSCCKQSDIQVQKILTDVSENGTKTLYYEQYE